VALRLDSSCMQNIDDSQEQWAEERGAIEQEVSRDLSNPTYKFITRLNEDLFSGTAYAHDALAPGVVRSHHGRHAQKILRGLVCAEQCDSGNYRRCRFAGRSGTRETALRTHQTAPVPAHPVINLPPVKAEIFTLDSNLPYVLVFVAFRMPGTSSPISRPPAFERCDRQPAR